MIRRIVKIDRGKCTGCGLCVSACREGAIGILDGKAALLGDEYCDGLGSCLPACPAGAITFEEREAAAFDEAAVRAGMEGGRPERLACGCPGTHAKAIERDTGRETERTGAASVETRLSQWPVQIKLVPPNAPYLKDAKLLVAADCAAYAYGDFHNAYMKGHITIIGCPKLDDGDYSEKLADIVERNGIQSVTVARMEVPCCGGIENAVKAALQKCGKTIPCRIVTISTDGRVLEK